MSPPEKITVNVLYFASLREQRGDDREEVSVEPDMAVEDLWSHLAQTHALRADQVMMAVNHEYARPGQKLCSGDEVAFFPPVTGG